MGNLDGLNLVLVEVNGLRCVCALAGLENVGAAGGQRPILNQLLHISRALIVWVDLQQGFGSVAPIWLPVQHIARALHMPAAHF